MVRAGLLFNAVGVVLVLAAFRLLGDAVLGVDPSVLPDWATH